MGLHSYINQFSKKTKKSKIHCDITNNMHERISDSVDVLRVCKIHYRCQGCETSLLSIYVAKLKTALLKTRALRAANDSQRAVNALTALQLIDWLIG